MTFTESMARVAGRTRAALFNRSTGSTRSYLLSGSDVDWRGKVGDGTTSSAVMATVQWTMRAFPEAPLVVFTSDATKRGNIEQVDRAHPLAQLIRNPNPFYTGTTLWQATVASYDVDGNAYWLVIRDTRGKPAELWWAPHDAIRANGTETELVTSYTYTAPGGHRTEFPAADVIHFRFGIDPKDMRVGLSPLKAALREVYTDDEAATYTAAILRNMGVPGVMVAPMGEGEIDPDDAEETKQQITAKFTGDKRGEPIVMTSATKLEQFGFNPDQMNLRDLRRIPEERVTAALGVPAVVVGLGAGLDRSTFNNMAEAREAAYEGKLIPTQNAFGEVLHARLLPEYEPNANRRANMRVGFDLDRVRVLQADQTDIVKRYDVGVRGGWVMVAEAREALGLPADESDRVYLIQSATAEVPADRSKPARNFSMVKSQNVTPGAE